MRNYNEKTDFSFDIRERLGVITEKNNGWKKELNIVCWNGREPAKFDIRDWSQDHSHMGRGATLYQEEMQTLVDLYQRYEEAMRESDAAERCRKQEKMRNSLPEEDHYRPESVQNDAASAEVQREEYQKQAAAQNTPAQEEHCGPEENPDTLLPENPGMLQQTGSPEAAALQSQTIR